MLWRSKDYRAPGKPNASQPYNNFYCLPVERMSITGSFVDVHFKDPRPGLSQYTLENRVKALNISKQNSKY